MESKRDIKTIPANELTTREVIARLRDIVNDLNFCDKNAELLIRYFSESNCFEGISSEKIGMDVSRGND